MSSVIKPPVVADHLLGALRLLVVSKESALVRSLASLGESGGWLVEIASSGWDAMERLESGDAPQLLLLDLPRGDGDSFHMLRWLRRLSPELPVVAICDAEDAAVRQEAVRLGAERILSRPLDPEQVLVLMRSYRQGCDAGGAEVADETVEQIEADIFFVTASPLMQKLRTQAELLAQSDVPVFLLGERGSGKSAVARLIHKLSARSGFRFLKINCAVRPESRVEEQLFSTGRVFGARLDGAAGGHFASIHAGERGTVLLEEIAAMPAAAQSRMVESLQNLEAWKNLESLKTMGMRSGSAEGSGPAGVRILSATSESIESAIGEGRLREDLYHRLSAFTLQVPSLRQRREEIPILMRYAMRKMASHYGMMAREFSSPMIDACQRYAWPGNLTELEAFVKRYLVAGEAELNAFGVDTSALDTSRVATPGLDTCGPADWGGPRSAISESGGFDSAPGNGSHPLGFLTSPAPANGGNGGETAAPASGSRSLKSLIQDITSEAEKKAIGAALERTGWNRKAAARLLRVSYRTLLYKIEQYRMKAEEPYFSATPETVSMENNSGKSGGKAS
ncbi:MAG TPA: sigma 54-interacting transcriptional regulator [Candidatus Sulfotelmatobacter sp.]